MQKKLLEKYKALRELVRSLESCIVAFSGGVDSSLVAKVAFLELGNNALAITVVSEVVPKHEIENAKLVAGDIGIKHKLLKINLLADERFKKNDEKRCYYCKLKIFKELKKIKEELGFKAIVDGTNYSDIFEDRPGIKALKELGVVSPLLEAKIKKDEVRAIAKYLKLRNFDRESYTCLATRLHKGQRITLEKLKQVEKAENFLRFKGLENFRVRLHAQKLAILEIQKKQLNLILENSEVILRNFNKLGFEKVAIDINFRESEK